MRSHADMKPFTSQPLDAHWPTAGSDEPLCQLPAALPLALCRRALVLAPHPDDECIGCGGVIALLRQLQVPVRIVLVTDGSGAGGLPAGAGLTRQQEFLRAAARLGVDDTAMLGFPDGGLARDEALAQAVQQQLQAFAPDWVFAPTPADIHRDHRAVAWAAREGAAAVATVTDLWYYETWTPLPVTHVLDITAVMATKIAALSEHVTALACGNYIDGTRGLAAHRGLLLPTAARPGAAGEGFFHVPRQPDQQPDHQP